MIMFLVGMVALATFISIIPTPAKEMEALVKRTANGERKHPARKLKKSKSHCCREPFYR